MLDDVLAAAIPELLLGQALQAQGALEVVFGHAVPGLELADLVVDLRVRDLDLQPDGLLAQDDVVDHVVEHLGGDPGGRGRVGRLAQHEADLLLQFQIGDDLAVDHGDDAVHDLGREGLGEGGHDKETSHEKAESGLFHVGIHCLVSVLRS